jgi:hypothetical protein
MNEFINVNELAQRAHGRHEALLDEANRERMAAAGSVAKRAVSQHDSLIERIGRMLLAAKDGMQVVPRTESGMGVKRA